MCDMTPYATTSHQTRNRTETKNHGLFGHLIIVMSSFFKIVTFTFFILFITPTLSWAPFQTKSQKLTLPASLENNSTAIHSHFMNIALEQARKAEGYGEVPIGAVVIERCEDGSFKVLSEACNLVETTKDASAHAELLALRKAASRRKNWRLLNTTLYSTLEPCPMCLAAAQAFRVSSVVYGAPDLRLGAIKTHIKLLDIEHPFHTIDEVVPDILSEESSTLLKSFFRRRRKSVAKKVGGNWRTKFRVRIRSLLR